MPLYRLFVAVLSCSLFIPFSASQATSLAPDRSTSYKSVPSYLGKIRGGRSFYIRGNCSASMRPDRVYIIGAVEGDGDRPVLAKQAIQQKMQGLQKLANKHGGKLIKMELMRSIKQERRRNYNTLDKKAGPQQVFVVTQRFELDFPVKANIDVILERFIGLGVDHIGKNVRRHRSSRPQILARYRFSNLKGQLVKIHNRCRSAAFTKWCETNAPRNEQNKCRQVLKKVAGQFSTSSMNLRSQQVLNDYGSTRSISLYYPWRSNQMKYFVLVGDVTLKMEGTINLRRNR